MRLPEPFRRMFPTPRLTRLRIGLAIAIALAADAVQVMLGPLGWTFFDEIIDVGVMILTARLIGFHVLLLPTFVVEILPIVDMLPTWTGCVSAVILLRRNEQRASPPPPPGPAGPAAAKELPCIDI